MGKLTIIRMSTRVEGAATSRLPRMLCSGGSRETTHQSCIRLLDPLAVNGVPVAISNRGMAVPVGFKFHKIGCYSMLCKMFFGLEFFIDLDASSNLS
jgi:hypothetical protein